MKIVTTLVNACKHDSAVRQHHATGVVLLSSTGELLFMNHEAQKCIRQLQPFTKENGTCLIPEDVRAVVSELIARLLGSSVSVSGWSNNYFYVDSACRTNRSCGTAGC